MTAALRRARACGATTVLNAAPFDAAIGPLLPLVDVLVVNEVEGADLLGWARVTAENARQAVGALLARGPSAVALTLGSQGALVGRGDERQHFPALPVAVVDTTAAGDAFTGALAAGLADGRDLFAAARRAVIVGSLAVTQAGAQLSLPHLAAVQAAENAPDA